jgi:FKBP-type peptidyl-prolyl cis-trans isomerase SlyD
MKTVKERNMTITKNTVVTFDYTLKDAEGKVLDTSTGKEPVEYLHGYSQIIKGVEDNLEGKASGDNFAFVVEPANGYGEYDEQLLLSVPKSKIEGDDNIDVGSPITVRMKDGERIFTIVRVDKDDVVLDGNHPLAGVSLYFDVTIRDARTASAEEIEHGHSHDDAGCCDTCDECESDCGCSESE